MKKNQLNSIGTYKGNVPFVIAGSGRGGTTWLMELVCSDPAFKPVFEPLHELKVSGAEPWAYGYFPSTFSSLQAEIFFQSVFEGSLQTPWTRLKPWMNDIQGPGDKLSLYKKLAVHKLQEMKKNLTAKRLAVKFIRANLMLTWLHSRFNARILLVVRSPYDICSSMIRTGWFEHHLQFGYRRYLYQQELVNDYLQPHIEWMRTVEDPLERVCIMWTIENMVPLTGEGQPPMTVIPYEYMISFGPEEFRKVFNAVGLDIRFNDSMITKPSSRSFDGKRFEKRPQDELEERSRVLIPEIMNRFGFDFYNENGLPNDQSALYSKWNIGLFKP